MDRRFLPEGWGRASAAPPGKSGMTFVSSDPPPVAVEEQQVTIDAGNLYPGQSTQVTVVAMAEMIAASCSVLMF